jgi:hypothetical protein
VEAEERRWAAAVSDTVGEGGPAVDGHFEPAGAARVARGREPFWARALTTPGPSEPGWGPAPPVSRWLRFGPASSGAGAIAASEIEVRVDRVAWGTSAAPLAKSIARVTLRDREGRGLDVGASIADDDDAARAGIEPLARGLADSLGVPASGLGEGTAASADAEGSADPIDARGLLRWTLGWEADRGRARCGALADDRAARGPRRRVRARRLHLLPRGSPRVSVPRDRRAGGVLRRRSRRRDALGAAVVSLDTEHGPIDVARATSRSEAEILRATVERALAGVAGARKRSRPRRS